MSCCDRINCGYYYKSEEDYFPCCHYDDPWPAPCEYDDEGDDDDYDDYDEEVVD